MNALKVFVIFSTLLALAYCAPNPSFFGGGGKHEHHTIHVPYKVHTIHHHHIKKVPVEVVKEVIKEVPVIKEVHVPVLKEVHIPVHIHHQEEHHHIEEEHDFHKRAWHPW
ncbi:polyadenylate-binding protein 1-B [Eurosta solidaginis]|uniref:polyadenylate-binding protein 1-B n=1 Tax=Eurosta solidaginis TaxID=178769 RepID=UPI00353151F5